MRFMYSIGIAALIGVLAAPTVALANTTTMTCVTDSGREVVSLTLHGRSLVEMIYLDADPQRVVEIESSYIGGTVMGVVGWYSPMLRTQLEVTRDFNAEERTYRGKLWPIGASNAWDVTCM